MGGKHLIKSKIVDLLPKDYEDMIYVEPFVGGGSVLLEKEPSYKEIINDFDEKVIIVYKGYKKYSDEEIANAINGKYSKTEFKEILDSKPSTDFGKFIRQLKLFKISYFGKGQTFIGDDRNSINYNKHYHERLKDVNIYNDSYEKILKKFDSNNTIFYLDPPYENSNKEHYDNYGFDYEKLYSILSKLKGKFLLSINDSPNIKKIFSKFNISNIQTKYTDPLHGAQSRNINELIIKNY